MPLGYEHPTIKHPVFAAIIQIWSPSPLSTTHRHPTLW